MRMSNYSMIPSDPQSSHICSIEGGGEGGGGGGDDEEAKWNARFHKASTEREKRFKASLVKELGSMFETQFGSKFDELRKILVESPEPGGKERESNDGEGKGGKMSSEVEAMIRQAQRDAKEAKQLADKWQSEATAEKTRASKNEEREALRSQLTGKVKPALLDMVVDQLHARHIIRDSESKTILWKDDEGQTLPLKEAVASWAKSDVGKEFTPPRDVRGTGSRGNTPEDNASRIPGSMNAETLGGIVLGSIPGSRG